MSDEQNVWSCLLAYNKDSADEISAQYRHSLPLILSRLSSYAGKSQYHGHISGGSGDAEHAGAADARAAALAHLRSYTPPAQEEKVASVAGRAKKSLNLKMEGALLNIISDHKGNVPQLEAALTLENPNWRNIRAVNASYLGWKARRKAQFGPKKVAR